MEYVAGAGGDRYPVDYDVVEKGDVFRSSWLAERLGVGPEDGRYRTKLLEFRANLARELEARGRVFTLREDHGDLRVLTDPEAAEYNARRYEHHERGLGAAHHRNLHVDVVALDQAQRLKHDRQLAVMGVKEAARRAAAARVRQLGGGGPAEAIGP